MLTKRPTVLLVDDERYVLDSWNAILEEHGSYRTALCSDSRQVMDILNREQIAAVVLDLVMPHVSGEQLLDDIKAAFPEVPVIVITGVDDISLAVECMRRGAFDYLVKPVEEGRLISSIGKAIHVSELHGENRTLKDRFLSRRLDHPEAFSAIVTVDERMFSLFLYLEAIAQTSQPVLITGESGVGKDLFAAVLHELSGREGQLVPLNIAGFDDPMFSDALFGHTKGSYTGASQPRRGMIEAAADGTLFLDEIGELSNSSQVKLLRLVEAGEYYPIGSDTVKRSRARLVMATNRELLSMVEEGSFRKDLYYRLSTHQLEIPPLRERKADIPLLVDHFFEQAVKELGRKKPTAPPQLYTLLEAYDFPGNVRELRSLIYDALSRHNGGVLSLAAFKDKIKRTRVATSDAPPDRLMSFGERLPTVDQANRMLIDEAMKRAKGNQSVAAQLIGLTQQALSKRLARSKSKR